MSFFWLSQLAITHASEETLPRTIEFLIRETHNWFSYSFNRELLYKELYKTVNYVRTYKNDTGV